METRVRDLPEPSHIHIPRPSRVTPGPLDLHEGPVIAQPVADVTDEACVADLCALLSRT